MEELMQKLKERLLGAKLDDCISSGAYCDIASLITEIEQLHKHIVSNSLPADVDMWKQEYDGACREIMSLQEQLKEAEREIADLNAELRNAHF